MKIYFTTGRYVLIGSGFCVLKVLIQLRKTRAFPCAFMKKRIYWPSVVSRKDMEDDFVEVKVGETYAIQGTVNDVIYNSWGMKENIYVMRMMATGGRLLADDVCRETVRRWNENG